MNKKGFTLVELLAVIVILAIILAIAVPLISGLIDNARKSAFSSDTKMILKQLDYEKLKNDNFDVTTVNESTIGSFGLSSENYQTLSIEVIDGEPYIVVVGKGKWNGYKACGTYHNITVTDNSDTTTCVMPPDYYDETKGVNEPFLATGMTPIKWNGTAWVDTTASDTSWYNYDTTNKIWANARTADGSMWVWIPRFIYKISSGWHTSTAGTINIQFTKGVNDNWNSSSIGNISTDTTSNASNNTWTNHPAFTFGDTELTGIWVSKFEASSSNPAATNGGGNVTTLYVKSIPNVASWRAITINNIFIVTRSMETSSVYGWGTTGTGIDTHMMKNSEWGAVAYLSKSVYGKNAEIWINNSNTYTTGCAANSVSEATYAGCENTYNTPNGLQASTTGNIYGIYDMSGSAWEYTAAYVNNGHTNLTTNGNSIINADSKYKDVYTMGSTDTNTNNYDLTINHKGDAIYETSANGSDSTSAWYSDYSYMMRTDQPWFAHGGFRYDQSGAGIFYFGHYYGIAENNGGFRGVVLVGADL